MVKNILHLFIVQLPLYSIPAYQSYYNKKSHQNPEANTQLHFNNKTTPKLHGGKNGGLNGLKLKSRRRACFGVRQGACPGLVLGTGEALVLGAWVEVAGLSRREGVNAAAPCLAPKGSTASLRSAPTCQEEECGCRGCLCYYRFFWNSYAGSLRVLLKRLSKTFRIVEILICPEVIEPAAHYVKICINCLWNWCPCKWS